MTDKKSLSSSTNTDTDSLVIFIGESKNIKTNAELHPEQSKFGTDFVHFVPETPTSKQTGRKKRILQTFIPDSQDQHIKDNGKLSILFYICNMILYYTKTKTNVKMYKHQEKNHFN